LFSNNDPFSPDLAGRAPGVSDPLIVWDNNKAQINMDFTGMTDGGADTIYGIVHNGELNPRDITIGMRADPEVLRQLRGAQVEVIGGKGQPFENGGRFTLANVLPGENRWIGVTLPGHGGDGTQKLPVTFVELAGNQPVNGFTIVAVPSPLRDLIREDVKFHAAVYTRLHSAFDIDPAEDEGEDALHLAKEKQIPESVYLDFLKSHATRIGESVNELLKKEKGQDPFAIHPALETLEKAITSGNAEAAVMADSALAHKLDTFQTMLQKQEGDPADILQMVRWQKTLYSSKPQLQKLRASRRVVEESQGFIEHYGKHKRVEEAYHELMERLLSSLHETAEDLEKLGVRVEPEIHEIAEHLGSTRQLEKAHRDYLVKLQGI
jgi:hypothetical protein